MKNQVAEIILDQLGGNKFIVMTGAKDFIADNDKLTMTLTRNSSKANRLEITYTSMDLYTMRFYKYTPMRWNSKKLTFTEEKVTEVKKYENVYCFQLQSLYTEITGQYTHL